MGLPRGHVSWTAISGVVSNATVHAVPAAHYNRFVTVPLVASMPSACQVAAEALGIPLSSVFISETATDKVSGVPFRWLKIHIACDLQGFKARLQDGRRIVH